MKKFLIFVIIFNAILFASDNNGVSDEKKIRLKKQIEKEMQKEKKYAREQTFYQGKNYDLKGAEVNEESLSSLPILEADDLDMDDVYD